MNVFAIGTEKGIEELHELNKNIVVAESTSDIISKIKKGDAVIHLWEDESMEELEALLGKEGIVVLVNSVKTTLSEIALFNPKRKCTLMGFAGIPGFINREKWDVSCLDKSDLEKGETLFKEMGVKMISVDDRVGMVTPRVVSMIINEAYFTVMEGTAEKDDIDIAMKLGTNYPGGPFHWVEKIGIDHIYEILDALYEDTKDERYKICPLLKKEYLQSMR